MRGRIGIGRWLWIAAIASLFSQLASAQVRINELQAKNRFTVTDDDNDPSDWIELMNVGSESVDLFGYRLSDDPDNPAKWTFPRVELTAGERILVWCSDKNRHVPSDEAIEAEDSTIPFTPTLIDEIAEWSYRFGPPEKVPPPLGWNQVGYDASDWPKGRAPIGFGGAGIRTELPPSIGAVFLRHEFKVEQPAHVPNLILDATFDDGFVVWLNGVRVLEVGYPADEPDPTFASCAQAAREKRRGRWNLSEHLALLRRENVLAVALLNAGPTSGDLQLALRLGTVAPVLHANFALGRSGETIVLTDPSGKIVDSVRFPEQDDDRTYGRYPDGTGKFHYMALPTPEAPNDHRVATQRIPSEIEFSPPPGAHEKPVEVTLESHVPFSEYEIRYTTDGEEPTPSSPLYEGPIPITSDTSLRARGFLGGEPITRTMTASYFGMTPTTRELALPVMSITLPPREYQFVHNNADARGRTAERSAHMEIFDERGKRTVDLGMGIRIHGDRKSTVCTPVT